MCFPPLKHTHKLFFPPPRPPLKFVGSIDAIYCTCTRYALRVHFGPVEWVKSKSGGKERERERERDQIVDYCIPSARLLTLEIVHFLSFSFTFSLNISLVQFIILLFYINSLYTLYFILCVCVHFSLSKLEKSRSLKRKPLKAIPVT